jgi:hypothetical protein
MRVCLKVRIPVETGNDVIMNGKIQPALKELLDRLQPEATYFLTENGLRGFLVFFDLKDTAQIPAICEPLFMQLNAEIEMAPAMNLDDLMAGFKQFEESR